MEKVIHEQRRRGLTREQELELLADIYKTALEAHRRRKAVGVNTNAGDDGESSQPQALKPTEEETETTS